MSPPRRRRGSLRSLTLFVLLVIGTLAGVLGAGWGPKLGLDLEGGFSVTLQPVTTATSDSLDKAIEVIRSRVDALGVAEPEITRQGSTIEVSLPGVTDRERARELVGQTAELRFRPVLSSIPGSVEDLLKSAATSTTTAPPTSTTLVEETSTTAGKVTGQSTGSAAARYQDATTSTSAPEGIPITGFELTPRAEDLPDQPVTLAEVDSAAKKVTATYQLGPAGATGKIVQTATATLSQSGQWAVALEIKGGNSIGLFNAMAAECFSKAPTCPSGQLAIVLDSVVVSAPTIQQASFQRDQIQISGNFSESEAKDLALVLRYGSLPVALEVQQTREVSATLGSDSLRAGIISGAVGLALVALFMLIYYRLLGLVAIFSLAMSGAMLWTIVCWLGESRGLALTLAGITGIVVSIGIAMDSNIVFYEHLKEDVARGRSIRGAVSGSFESAFSTIVKADVASLIGAVLLYVLTVGSVRGFALFLGLSTVLDLVSSYWFMRPLVVRIAVSERFKDRPSLLGLPSAKEVQA